MIPVPLHSLHNRSNLRFVHFHKKRYQFSLIKSHWVTLSDAVYTTVSAVVVKCIVVHRKIGRYLDCCFYIFGWKRRNSWLSHRFSPNLYITAVDNVIVEMKEPDASFSSSALTLCISSCMTLPTGDGAKNKKWYFCGLSYVNYVKNGTTDRKTTSGSGPLSTKRNSTNSHAICTHKMPWNL